MFEHGSLGRSTQPAMTCRSATEGETTIMPCYDHSQHQSITLWSLAKRHVLLYAYGSRKQNDNHVVSRSAKNVATNCLWQQAQIERRFGINPSKHQKPKSQTMSLDYHIYTAIEVYCLYLAFERMQKMVLRRDYHCSPGRPLAFPQRN